jgi:TolA-binding protein
MPRPRILLAFLIIPLSLIGQDIDDAIRLFESFQFDHSRIIFEDIVKKGDNPRLAEAHYYLGRLSINPDSALTHYRIVIKDYPQSRYVDVSYLEIAKINIARENYQDAIVTINELMKNFPDIGFKDEALFWLGVSYIGAGQKDLGHTTLKNLIAAYPKSDWSGRASSIIPDKSGTPPPGQPPDVPKDYYTIQIGSYRNETNAQKVAKDLRGKGFTVRVVPAEVKGNQYFRVWVGQFPTADAAKAFSPKLDSLGIKGNVVKGY